MSERTRGAGGRTWRRAAWAAPVVALTALVTAGWGEAHRADDEAAIRETVELYFAGMMEAKPELLRRAFHPVARLIGAKKEGGLWVIPVEEWAASWEGREPRSTERYRNRIISVDVYGAAASVKTQLDWPEVRYVDYLSLVEVDGEWRIVNKIWTQEPPGS